MKNQKIIFWITTGIIFIMEGLIPLFTSQSELAKEGIRHLGYPEYFGNALVVFKVLGTFSLIIPQVSKRIKEWAYAGFAFNFIFAIISNIAVDDLNPLALFPLAFLGLLIASYISYNKLNSNQIK
ncbi:MAG: DoxX family protein [Bacteroidia bacterium]|nr:DoxX family protein [Bacteroidia bacterium]